MSKNTKSENTRLKRFSFIIPARNEERSIVLCIESILSQNYSRDLIEIIVIDDYSSDKTFSTAENLGATVISPPLPMGKTTRASNKNSAVNFSKGDYLIFLDAHAILPSKNWLSKLSELLKHEDNCVGGFFASFPAIPPPELTLLLNLFTDEEVKTIALAATTERGPHQFVGGSMLIPKGTFIKLGGFPIVPASEDIGLYLNALESGAKYRFISEQWVWHLDKKLRSAKNWFKRNAKEGYFSTVYGWDQTRSDKYGKFYSILLFLAVIGVFIKFSLWIFLFVMLSVIIVFHSYHGIRTMENSNGHMSLYHLIVLVLIEVSQALIFRLTVAVAIPIHFFVKLVRYVHNELRK